MRVALYPINVTGCGRLRMMLPAEHSGVDYELLHGISAYEDSAGNVAGVDRFDTDVVVLQRPNLKVAQAIPFIQKQGVAVVVEVDDDVGAASPRAPLVRAAHQLARHAEGIRLACKHADVVTVSTPLLALRYRRDAIVIRNTLPSALLDITREHDGRTIGWGGIAHEHPGDFDRVGTGLEIHGTRFLTVGEAPRLPGVSVAPEQTGPLPFYDEATGRYPYHEAMAKNFTVGLAPLANNAFNRAKSWLKPLDYAALGIPCVRANLPEYDRLGYGLQATRPREWKRCIKSLLDYPDTVAGYHGAYGRELVRERYTIEQSAHLWAEAWELALERRRGTPSHSRVHG